MRRHIRGLHSEDRYKCEICLAEFKWVSSLKKHLQKHSQNYHSKMVIETQTDNGFNEKEDNVEDMKQFTCEICSKLFNRKDSKKRHVKEVHQRKCGDVKHNEKMGNETVSDENKYIESILNKVKTDFERKRELGKIAMEMIDKYDLNVHGMPQEVKNAIKFNLKMEGLC